MSFSTGNKTLTTTNQIVTNLIKRQTHSPDGNGILFCLI